MDLDGAYFSKFGNKGYTTADAGDRKMASDTLWLCSDHLRWSH